MENLWNYEEMLPSKFTDKINECIDLLAYLKDFYFEARSPGDNFTSVTKSDRDRCLEIMNNIISLAKPYIPKEYLPDDLSKEMTKF